MKKSILKFACFLAICISTTVVYTAHAQSSVSAIDVLLDPDQTMLDTAKVYNDLMRTNYSNGFALDATHTPHVTILQCFVHTADLDKVYVAVSKLVKSENPSKEKLTASGFYFIPYKNLGLAGITAMPTPRLLDFQAKLIEALKPFLIKGTVSAFVQNADGTPVAGPSADYVNGFIPNHSGAKYNPHVTIGLAEESFLKELLARPFNSFTFKSPSVSIYHLGDFGTAQIKLWTSAKQ